MKLIVGIKTFDSIKKLNRNDGANRRWKQQKSYGNIVDGVCFSMLITFSVAVAVGWVRGKTYRTDNSYGFPTVFSLPQSALTTYEI